MMTMEVGDRVKIDQPSADRLKHFRRALEGAWSGYEAEQRRLRDELYMTRPELEEWEFILDEGPYVRLLRRLGATEMASNKRRYNL